MSLFQRRPLEVILDTTERCNLKCKMCYFSAVDRLQFLPFDRQLSGNGMMPPETFQRIAADLFPRAHKVALGCAAEPLVHPKFVDFVRESGRYGIPDLWFPTNLLPLTPKKAEAICEAGVSTVAVSMDGTHAKTYEAIRVGGTFARFRRSLDLLNEVRRGTATRLRFIFVWMQTNRADLANLPRFAQEVGASELDVRFVAPTAHVTAEDELLDGEDPSALRAELAAVAEDAAGRGLRLVSYPDFNDGGRVGLRGHLLRWRAGLYDRRRLRGRLRTAVAGCAWPGRTVVVRPNGAVSPCIFWEEQPIGLYPESSIEEIDRSPLLAAITDGLRTGNPCGTCRTCSERKHALYFRLQWRQQVERLEQLGAGPGNAGVVAPASGSGPGNAGVPLPSARSDASTTTAETVNPAAAVSLGARAFRPASGSASAARSDASTGTAESANPAAGVSLGARAFRPASASAAAPPDPKWGLPAEVSASLDGAGPIDWMTEYAPAKPFDRVLLIGDEAWAAELIRAGFAANVDVVFWPASDAMPRSGEPVPPSIRRLLLDPRHPQLPAAAYQAVCCVGGLSVHLRLERLLVAVLEALEPGGRLIVDDYVGPARHQWSGRAGAAAVAAYRRLPAGARRFDRLLLPPPAGDCAHAIRSRDLGRLIRTGFRVESVRPYGGNLVAPLHSAVDWRQVPADDLRRLVEGDGGAGAHYALTVARPRLGLTRRLARLRYQVGPKLRRVFVYEPRRARDLVLQALRGNV